MDMAIVPSSGCRTNALQAWASHVGVGDGVGSLEAEVGEAKLVLAMAGGMEIQNESLVSHLKELDHRVRDAENVLDELDYSRIQDEVLEGAPDMAEGTGNDQLVDNLTNQMSNLLFSEHGEAPEISASNVVVRLAHNSAVNSSASSSTSLQIVSYVANQMDTLVPRHELDRDDIHRRITEHVNKLHEMSKDARKALKLEKLDVIAFESESTIANPRETTSCVTEPKVYGRDQEREYILGKLTSDQSGKQNLPVIVIVGNGGVGKTTLARWVLDDPRVVESLTPVWIYVSVSFDEVKLTHEVLECLYGERYEGIKELKKLQEILEYGLKSKRFLLVMDDMWEDQDRSRWDRFLAPFKHGRVKGSMILVTTRKLSVAKMIGATDTIKLDGLKADDFWHLFKECAFGDANHEGHPKLQKIGQQIVRELKGYPLAAKSIGTLLKRKFHADHWRRILESNEWKYQRSNDDIIPALKVSYNYLPSHLQRCFSYCALFPKNYWFYEEQLVNMWIAQGFVDFQDKGKRKEDIGSEYINDLVEWGFFLKEPPRAAYLMHDLIHDLAQIVSFDECFTIDGLTSRSIPRLVHHVSVITESAYGAKLDGSISPNECFKREFANASCILQTKNLSTLMLIGGYDSNFATAFRNELDKVRTVRVLKLEMIFHDVDSLVCNLSAFVHLRYLELASFYTSSSMQLPDAICRLYHLEVLDIRKNNWGLHTDLPRDMSNLVNLRHFIAAEALHAKIARVGKLVFLQELKAFHVKKKIEFGIGQLKHLKELRRSLSIYNLENLESCEEAAEARLKDKIHLEGLRLSWDVTNAARFACKLEHLEYLQPHPSLKYLQIDGYRGAAPTWLMSDLSLTSLQSLHLENCRWRIVPPLEQLPLLKELHLVFMPYIRRVQVCALEVLELRQMPRLEECIMIDGGRSSRNLRVLEIVECRNLRELPFMHCSPDVQNEHRFPHLHRLQIRECPPSVALPAIPPSDQSTKIDVCHVGSIPFSSFSLEPAALSDGLCLAIEGGPNLNMLDNRILAFHNLKDLRELEITNCPNLTYLMWEGFQQFTLLKRLKIQRCVKLFSSLAAQEKQDSVRSLLPTSLEELHLCGCDITGKQLSQVLSNLQSLSSLKIARCEQITSLAIGLLIDEGNPMEEGLCCIPPHCLQTLEMLEISFKTLWTNISSNMVFRGKKGLGDFVSLEELVIEGCSHLLSSMVSEAALEANCSLLPSSLKKLRITDLPDKLLSHTKPCSLAELDVSMSPSLTSLELHSCTALQKLKIEECSALASLGGLQSLASLALLMIRECPGLTSVPLHSCTRLQHLSLERCKALSSFEGSHSLASLSELKIYRNPRFASLKLHGCTALEKLVIEECPALALMDGLQSLTRLKYMTVWRCPGFASCWNTAAQEVERASSGFSLSLEELVIDDINVLTVPICRLLNSLKTLTLSNDTERFTDQHEEALQLLTSLKELSLLHFDYLQSLPAELHRLICLETLRIKSCPHIMSLPEKGLPTSLKEVEVSRCRNELIEMCKNTSGIRQLYINGWEA